MIFWKRGICDTNAIGLLVLTVIVSFLALEKRYTILTSHFIKKMLYNNYKTKIM